VATYIPPWLVSKKDGKNRKNGMERCEQERR